MITRHDCWLIVVVRNGRGQKYMSNPITGTLSVSNDVIADIAGYAALSCYGVVGMAEQAEGVESVRVSAGQRLRKGVLVTNTEAGLQVDLYVIIEAGLNMKSICNNLASAVSFTLTKIAQIDAEKLKVVIHIQGMKHLDR